MERESEPDLLEDVHELVHHVRDNVKVGINDPRNQADDVYDTVDGVLRDQHVQLGKQTDGGVKENVETNNFFVKEGVVGLNINGPMQTCDGVEMGKKIVGQDCNNEDILLDGPSWSLGISQNDVQQSVKELLEKGPGVDVTTKMADGTNANINLGGPSWSLGFHN
ncbi:hypothetical protein R6Q59_031169 [Mikania micrantha]